MPEDFGARSSFVAPANTDAKIWRLVERAARPKGRPAAACGRCGLVMASYPKRTSICVAASAKRLRRQFSSCRPYYSNRGERRETIMVRLSNHHLLRQSSNSKKKRDDADVNSYPSHRDEPRQNEQHIQSQRRPLSVPPRNKCSTCSGSIRPQCITR